MTHMFCIAILVALVILLIFCLHAHATTDQYIIKGMIVNVRSDYDNREDAVRIVLECNNRMIRLLAHLQKKYKIGLTDDECQDECRQWIARNYEQREIVRHLLRDFNYEAIYEHRPPPGSKSVAYSLNKGGTIMLCLRDNENPHNIVDIDTLMFVVLHEAAHVANYDEWGHETRFWRIFKYLLEEAVEVGIIRPIDYIRKPKNYCGFKIDHNPLFDSRIVSLTNP